MSEAVEQLVVEIDTLDLEGLRTFWRERFGTPPHLRSEPIMRQLLAWRVQAQAMGGLDTETGRAIMGPSPSRSITIVSRRKAFAGMINCSQVSRPSPLRLPAPVGTAHASLGFATADGH